MNRREFVICGLAAGCGCLASCTGQVAPIARSGPVDVGPLAEYSKEGVTARWAETHEFYVVREHSRLFAVSAICTHKRCLVKPEENKAREIVCECHGSRFTQAGALLKGPARRSLPHLGIALNSAGRIVVDSSRKFDESQWDQPEACIAVA